MKSQNQEDRWLICEVLSQPFALCVSGVVELLSLRDILVTPIPNTPDHICGLINLRGQSLGLLDVRTMFGMQSMQDETEEVLQMLSDREQDHIHWLNELAASVRENRPFSLATDPHLCKFGVWYDQLMGDREELSRFTNDQLSLLEVLDQFDLPHQRIHSLAEQMADLRNADKTEDAIALLDEAKNTDLKLLLELFEKTRQMIRTLRHGVAIVVETKSKRLALLFDNASEVKQFPAEAHRPLETANNAKGLISGFIQDEETEDLIQVIGLEEIADFRSSRPAPVSKLAPELATVS